VVQSRPGDRGASFLTMRRLAMIVASVAYCLPRNKEVPPHSPEPSARGRGPLEGMALLDLVGPGATPPRPS
jgi:hypothetical protein